jgi:hypothetical protein
MIPSKSGSYQFEGFKHVALTQWKFLCYTVYNL